MATNPRSEEKNPAQSAQEATQATRDAARKGADQADRIGRVTAEVSSRAAKASADLLGRNVETTQHVLQSGAQMAAKLTERSAQQFGRSLGLIGEDAERTAQSYSHNLGAILQSSVMLADMAQDITREWLSFGRNHWEKNFDQLDKLLHSRNPHDFLAQHSELMRDTLEGLLGCTRRVAEKSMRSTEELAKTMSDSADQGRRAA
jgi:phasin family protein